MDYISYAVSARKLNLIEADDLDSVYGTAALQSGGPFSATSLTGRYVFSMVGTNKVFGIAEAGQFTADGGGAINGVGERHTRLHLDRDIRDGDRQWTRNHGACASRILPVDRFIGLLHRLQQHHLSVGNGRRRSG